MKIFSCKLTFFIGRNYKHLTWFRFNGYHQFKTNNLFFQYIVTFFITKLFPDKTKFKTVIQEI